MYNATASTVKTENYSINSLLTRLSKHSLGSRSLDIFRQTQKWNLYMPHAGEKVQAGKY